ncbi:hypothetical protein Tsubulata_028049 [Turnera subulata]|uniref:Bidirectional sugar transporter SWEET n=1 Tax=Turnera subulata TaxID=218843 RepID=A0A9Q0FKK5_9ROSI|nr:hypothetical protein Tsubulata_028049 [Turnera subulata]
MAMKCGFISRIVIPIANLSHHNQEKICRGIPVHTIFGSAVQCYVNAILCRSKSKCIYARFHKHHSNNHPIHIPHHLHDICTTKRKAKLLIGFNGVAYGLIVVLTAMLSHGNTRLSVVGTTTVVFSVCVYAAPLSVMRKVIKTKSVEFMPFSLSLSLTVCAVCWFAYGMFLGDWFIAAPNILGFLFGMVQMVLYLIYRKKQKKAVSENRIQELAINPSENGKSDEIVESDRP